MADGKDVASGGFSAFFSHLPKEIMGIVGVIFLFLFFLSGMMAISKVPKLFDALIASYSSQPAPCWEVKEFNSRVISYNQCTGAFKEILLPVRAQKTEEKAEAPNKSMQPTPSRGG
jgi:hypothetical protein